MNKSDLFDLLFTDTKFVIEHEGSPLRCVINDNKKCFVEEDTGIIMVHITGDSVFCTECGCEMQLNNCESVNDHTIKLVCPECLYEYKVTFVNPNKIPLSDEVKALMDGSTYVIKVAGETLHALYTDGQFRCIEKSDELVKPDLVEREIFLTNSQLCELRG